MKDPTKLEEEKEQELLQGYRALRERIQQEQSMRSEALLAEERRMEDILKKEEEHSQVF